MSPGGDDGSGLDNFVDATLKSHSLSASAAAQPEKAQPTSGTLDLDLARNYARKVRALREAEAVVRTAKQRVEAAAELMLPEMTSAGVTTLPLDVDGERMTIYLDRTMRASIPAANRELAHAALRDAGAGDLIKPTVNANTLSSWVRECLRDGGELPATLSDFINIHDKPTVRARQG